MSTLLILGSKPDPNLPPLTAIDAVACANGSGYSAAHHGLPTPSFTVMSAILATTDSGKQTLEALRGLETDTLYFLPRPARGGGPWKRLGRTVEGLRASPLVLKSRLRRVGYRYRDFVVHHSLENRLLIDSFCGHRPELMALTRTKQPSTGLMTLLIGMGSGAYDRFVLSGFSFELTHAYGANPEIDERGTRTSRHADTDIAVLRALMQRSGRVYTTEPRVFEAAGVPLLDSAPGAVSPEALSSRA